MQNHCIRVEIVILKRKDFSYCTIRDIRLSVFPILSKKLSVDSEWHKLLLNLTFFYLYFILLDFLNISGGWQGGNKPYLRTDCLFHCVLSKLKFAVSKIRRLNEMNINSCTKEDSILCLKTTLVKILFLLFLSIKKLKYSSTIYKIGVEFSQLSIAIISF